MKYKIKIEKREDFYIHEGKKIRFLSRLCVPKKLDIKQEISTKAHSFLYIMHLETTKIYNDLKEHY